MSKPDPVDREGVLLLLDAFCLAEKRDDCPRCSYYTPGTFCPECRDPRNIAAEIRARGEE